LYQDAPYKHWNEFAALEDHLCGVIEVPQWRVGESHGAKRQQS
jgi:hypothetical protein